MNNNTITNWENVSCVNCGNVWTVLRLKEGIQRRACFCGTETTWFFEGYQMVRGVVSDKPEEAPKIKTIPTTDPEQIVYCARRECYLPHKYYERIGGICPHCETGETFFLHNPKMGPPSPPRAKWQERG